MDEWIMNSGATCHISCNRELFDDFDASHLENVAVANGEMVVASGEDSVVIYPVNNEGRSSKDWIENVLYVPQIDGNLISVKRLAQRGIKVKFSHN